LCCCQLLRELLWHREIATGTHTLTLVCIETMVSNSTSHMNVYPPWCMVCRLDKKRYRGRSTYSQNRSTESLKGIVVSNLIINIRTEHWHSVNGFMKKTRWMDSPSGSVTQRYFRWLHPMQACVQFVFHVTQRFRNELVLDMWLSSHENTSNRLSKCRQGISSVRLLSILPAAVGPGFTQPLTKMSTENIKITMFLGSKVRPVRRAANLTAICEPTV
jgi:hypothetical protein